MIKLIKRIIGGFRQKTLSVKSIIALVTSKNKKLTYQDESLRKFDEYKVIMTGNIVVAQGYECSKCKIIRQYYQPICNCS